MSDTSSADIDRQIDEIRKGYNVGFDLHDNDSAIDEFSKRVNNLILSELLRVSSNHDGELYYYDDNLGRIDLAERLQSLQAPPQEEAE